MDAITIDVAAAADGKRIVDRAAEIAAKWPELPHVQARTLLLATVARIEVHDDRVEIHLAPSPLASGLLGDDTGLGPASDTSDRHHWLTLTVPAQMKRAGLDVRMIIDGVDPYDDKPKPDRTLIRLIVRAHRFRDALLRAEGKTLEAIAAEQGVSGPYFTRVVRLAWLAPEIVGGILEGRHPVAMTAERLVRRSHDIPIGWANQFLHIASR